SYALLRLNRRLQTESTAPITNLNIVKQKDDTYQANCDVTITGQIYDVGITHVEKSSVSELVKIEKNKPKNTQNPSRKILAHRVKINKKQPAKRFA
ncbi:MAG: hypothetical protein MZU95_03960, partial [Desulfomicrobium escambiense]|nr:hypothetical protein [Desulfomicrobium escambiense]